MAEAPFQYQLHLSFRRPPPAKQVSRSLNVDEKLREILARDLTFKGEKTRYATHHLHAFPAKFPPQLPRVFIEALTNPGECVLDPMAGSGTTLVEALLHNRNAIGVDLDPLAIQVAKAKTTPLSIPRCAESGVDVVHRATALLKSRRGRSLSDVYPPDAVKFFQYWFDGHVISELHALVQAIRAVENPDIRCFLEVVFSSIIITKSGGLSRARDLAHSRPHRDLNKQIKQSALDAFSSRLHAAIDALAAMADVQARSTVLLADARNLPLENNSVDMIVTSPPYAANAIDYMRAHKFSLMWLGYEPTKLTQLRSTYIGAEARFPDAAFASPTANGIIQELNALDKNRASVVAFYYRDLETILKEMLRVLREGRAAVLVVGSSIIRGIDIKVPTVLAELADHAGFRVAGVAKREILRDARMMPVSHKTTKNGIEARMHEEGIVGAVKPPHGKSRRADT